jgi:hypothetical protein
VRKLKDDFLNDTSALASLAWDRSRGSDLRCLAQTIQCIAISKTSSFQATQKWLEDPTPLAHAFTANIENTYRVFEMLAQDPRHHTVFAKISPVEFIHVGILVHRHKARLTLDAMVEAIAAIRADVRNTHHEIRNNSKVNKTMHKFIDEYQGHTVKRGDVSAADAVRTNPTRSVGASTSAKAGTKRKATCALPDGDDDDSDDDYAPTLRVAPRKRAATAKTARASAPIPISIPGASTPAAASAGNAPSLHTIPASKKCIVARRLGADASVNAGVSGCCRLALTKGA